MTMRVVRWCFAIFAAVLAILVVVAAVGSRSSVLRELVVETLSDRLGSEVELKAFSAGIFPNVRVHGEGLVLHYQGRHDVPPLVRIRAFQIEGGIIGLLSRPRRFSAVRLDGLEIAVPPGGVDTDDAKAAQGSSQEDDGPSPIVIDRLEATDASFTLVPRNPAKQPRVFDIRTLTMTSVGGGEQIPFEAELTNPLPRGTIFTSGTFGPWHKDAPGATPLGGKYSFERVDMSTIKGLGGTLESTGQFSGQLGRIRVAGETRSPDFSLDIAQHPMPLTTEFDALVDGTDGDTYLNSVSAKLGDTPMLAAGRITGTPGAKGRTIAVTVTIDDGRMEDLLKLAVKSERPLVTGAVALKTDMTLPPGEPAVIDRLRLDGRFDLDAARFTSRTVQSKIAGMSHRARGKDADEPADNVVSDLEGRFKLRDGVLSLAALTFGVPGATVKLDGSYGLRGEALRFDGTLKMDATISEASGGGIKSFLLKAIDPLFRKGKAGAVVPIKVRGTRDDPKFGLDVGRVLSRD
jgi:uncharacterized protein involved in outer membrane biogenesis